MEKEAILLNLPRDLGDALICTPAIRRLKDHCDTWELNLITLGSDRSHAWSETLTGLKLDRAQPSGLQGKNHFLLNLNFHDHAIADKFPAVPYFAPEKLQPCTEAGMPQVASKHISLLIEDALRDTGILEARENLPPPSFPPEFTAPDEILRVQNNFGIRGDYALLVPVCAADFPKKKWQKEHFADVANWLSAQGVTPVLLGGPSNDEKLLCYDIEELAHIRMINLCGRTSLPEIAALAKSARLTLGNDTGPTHLAAAAGATVFAIFGNDDVIRTWAPAGATVVRGWPSIQDLKPQQVIYLLEEALTPQALQKINKPAP